MLGLGLGGWRDSLLDLDRGVRGLGGDGDGGDEGDGWRWVKGEM